jgi:hypothetical protein
VRARKTADEKLRQRIARLEQRVSALVRLVLEGRRR